jgi:hypothetical protein
LPFDQLFAGAGGSVEKARHPVSYDFTFWLCVTAADVSPPHQQRHHGPETASRKLGLFYFYIPDGASASDFLLIN